MNFLTRSILHTARSCLTKCSEGNKSQLMRLCAPPAIQGNVPSLSSTNGSYLWNLIQGFTQIRLGSSLMQAHKRGYYVKTRKRKNPLDGKPFAKGVVLKNLIRKPKKPNSANRKCVLVRLSNGKEMVAYVPGCGHNLQEHNIVLVKVGKLQDTPAVRLTCVRGKYDLPHVAKRST